MTKPLLSLALCASLLFCETNASFEANASVVDTNISSVDTNAINADTKMDLGDAASKGLALALLAVAAPIIIAWGIVTSPINYVIKNAKAPNLEDEDNSSDDNKSGVDDNKSN